ncbi:hypothetical protein [Nocardia sp. CA-290969]|uniref:hypothetical protein n=1 Tax=Nocardia sp. CA-290969 TaxID=3239986 RepID=UPI003D8FF62B
MSVLDPVLPAVAYAIGLFQADGSHEGSVEGKGRISLELAIRDQKILLRLSKTLPCYVSIGYRTRNTNFAEEYHSAVLRLYDRDIRRQFANFGVTVGRKSETIRPPDCPFAEPDYVRGLLDGDGSVGFTRKGEPFVGFVTVSEASADYYCQMVRRVCGVTRTPGRNQRDGSFNIVLLNQAAAQLAQWAWYSPDVLGIERKLVSARKVAAWAPPSEKAGRYGAARAPWTAADDQIVMTHRQSEAAQILGRTISSVSVRRWRLRKLETLSDAAGVVGSAD